MLLNIVGRPSLIACPLSVSGLLCLCFAWGGGAPLAGAAIPGNDRFADAIVLEGESVATNGVNVGASKEIGEPDHAGNAGGRSAWWSWQAPFSGSVIIHTSGSSFDTLLAVYTGTSFSELTLVAANDQDPLGIDVDTSRVSFGAVAGTTYMIAVDGFNAASGNILLTISEPPRPLNDKFANAIVLSGHTISTNGTTRDATKEEGEPAHAGEAGGKSIWWRWTAPFGGRTVLHTLGSDFDTVLAVYAGDGVDQLTLVAANDQDPMGGDTSRVTFDARLGARYEIAVDGWNAESGPVVLSLAMPLVAPTLLRPERLTNGNFQFTVQAAAGRTCLLESKTNLWAEWLALATNIMGSTGFWTFSDLAATNFPRRLYRARLVE
jgi:hypothetical protein